MGGLKLLRIFKRSYGHGGEKGQILGRLNLVAISDEFEKKQIQELHFSQKLKINFCGHKGNRFFLYKELCTPLLSCLFLTLEATNNTAWYFVDPLFWEDPGIVCLSDTDTEEPSLSYSRWWRWQKKYLKRELKSYSSFLKINQFFLKSY